MKRKKFVFLACLFAIVFSGCFKAVSEDQVIARVNGEKIYLSDLNLAKRQYEGRNLQESDIFGGIIKERLVLQEFAKIDDEISEKEIETQFQALKAVQNGDLFLSKAIEDYGSDTNVKAAIKFRLMFKRVKEEIREDFIETLYIAQEIMQNRTEDFVAQISLQNFNEDEIEEYRRAVATQYTESLMNELFDLHFQVWVNNQIECSNIEYYEGYESPFTERSSELSEVSLKEIGLREARDVYGNFLYLSPNIEENGDLAVWGYHDTSKQIKVLLVQYVDKADKMAIDILLEVSPDLELVKSGTRVYEEGITKVEIAYPEIGVRYTISADLDIKELEQEIRGMIPYYFDAQE